MSDCKACSHLMSVFALQRMGSMATNGSVCTEHLCLREIDRNLDAAEIQTQTLDVNWP